MTATLLGSFSLGDAIPGANDALDQAGTGLIALKGAVDGALDNLSLLQSTLDGLANDLDGAKDDLLNGPIDEFQNAVDTAQQALDDLLAISDPNAYLGTIIAGLNDAIALLEGLSAPDYLSDSIAAVTAAVNGQQARLDALASTVSDLTDISDDVRAQTALLGEIRNTLQEAAFNAIDGIVAYTAMASELLNSGVYVVSYVGPLSSLGADVDAVLPGTGIGLSETVMGPLLITKTANAATVAAIKNVFGLP
jgi:hypothetical protein